MILQLEQMPQIKIVLDKMLIHLVNIIHLNLEPIGNPRRRCGFPIGLIADPKSANDNDDYSIRNWIG